MTLLLLLSHFSRVRLCVIPEMAVHQAPPSLGFSRKEHWSGLPFPSPMHEIEVAQSCPTLSDPMVCSLSGSSVRGIFQARVLEWGAIAFSVLLLATFNFMYFYSLLFFHSLLSPLFPSSSSSFFVSLSISPLFFSVSPFPSTMLPCGYRFHWHTSSHINTKDT